MVKTTVRQGFARLAGYLCMRYLPLALVHEDHRLQYHKSSISQSTIAKFNHSLPQSVSLLVKHITLQRNKLGHAYYYLYYFGKYHSRLGLQREILL